jgi:hypothetical protein
MITMYFACILASLLLLGLLLAKLEVEHDADEFICPSKYCAKSSRLDRNNKENN